MSEVLGSVEEWADDREESFTAAGDDAHGEGDHHRDHDRDEHLAQRVHRVDRTHDARSVPARSMSRLVPGER